MNKRDFRLGDIMMYNGDTIQIEGKDMVIIEHQINETSYSDYYPIEITQDILENLGCSWEYDDDTANIKYWGKDGKYITTQSYGFNPKYIHQVQDDLDVSIDDIEVQLFE